ncbi:hypothetical protein, partial [Streptococcus halichoeri]
QDGYQSYQASKDNQETHERQVTKAHETGYQDGLAGRPPRVFEGFDKDDDIKASYDKGYQDGYQKHLTTKGRKRPSLPRKAKDKAKQRISDFYKKGKKCRCQ